MLYQLSYASPAQTEQNYHTGNAIATKFRRASARLLPVCCVDLRFLFWNALYYSMLPSFG